MQDFLWILFEIFITVFENFITCFFICKFLKLDLKSNKGKILLLSGTISFAVLVYIFNQFTFYEGVYGIIYTVQFFVFTLFIKSSFIKKVIISIIANLIPLFANSIVVNVVSTVFNSDIVEIYTSQTFGRIAAVILTQLLILYLYIIFLKFTDKNNFTLQVKELVFIAAIFVVSFVVVVLLHLLAINNNFSEYYTYYILAAEIGIVAINIVSFYMITYISRKNYEATKYKIESQQQSFKIRYAEDLKNQYEETQKFRHNLKQNFSVLSLLFSEGKYDEAEQFLSEYTDTLNDITKVIDVGNDILNAVINTKMYLAKEKGIEITCMCSDNITGISDVDICNLLGNIIDNAIEGCSSKNGKLEIQCNISGDNDKIIIIVKNSISESVLNNNKKLISTKKNKNLHGYGVKTIKDIVKQYNGLLDFYEKDGMFVCSTMLYKR